MTLRRVSGLAVAALLPCAGVVPAQERADPAIDLGVAREAFEQVRAIVAADGGELWGISLDTPILLVDAESRACAADRADAQGLLSEREGVWCGRFPTQLGVANTTTRWAGRRWTMLRWPIPDDEVERARLLMHETFHSAQFELGVSAATGGDSCPHLGEYDGRLWLRMEAHALVAALESEGAERDQAAADALLFRALRRSLHSDGEGGVDAGASAAEAEDALERLEGSAEYTGVRLCSPDARVRRAAAVELLRGLAARPSLTRSFQYATGPALGLLLDEYDPYWREAFLAGGTFSALLAPAVWFEVPAAELEGRALRRAKEYGFDEVVADETERERRRAERLAGYRARFVEGPVLVLPARSPRLTFDPGRIERLDRIGSVYGTLWLSDEWGVADAPGGGLVLDDRTVHLAAPADVEGPRIAGDGWTLDLSPGWVVAPGARGGDFRLVEGGK